MNKVSDWAQRIRNNVSTVFFGSDDTIDKILVALLCRGHVLIEDVPGVGKTILARSVSASIGGEFRQIQCTPDLLPADVLGVSVFNPKTSDFDFRPGPVITNTLLVDEISRATPRTQSALLEAMAEGQVSVEGRTTALPDPFFMIATESPVESEGTFPLPEVQKDRFFLSISIGYPDVDSERAVMKSRKTKADPVKGLSSVTELDEVRQMQEEVFSMHVSEELRAYILHLVRVTRDDERLMIGVSPRGSLALYKGSQALAAIRGRDYVTPEDVQDIMVPVLRKRILLKSEQSSRGVTEDEIIEDIKSKATVPPMQDAV
ncbi:MAG: AAA family ATPase [Spirochaetota bacterium]